MLVFWTLSIGLSAVMLGELMSRNTHKFCCASDLRDTLYVLYLDWLQHESDTSQEAGIEKVFSQFPVSYGAVIYS